jgi:hypothetical protein
MLGKYKEKVITNQGFKLILTLNILGYHQGRYLEESHLMVLNDLESFTWKSYI